MRVAKSAEGCFECEIGSVGDKTIYFPQYHSARRNGRDFRLQRRQAARNEIGIDEVDHPRVFRQITACERRLTVVASASSPSHCPRLMRDCANAHETETHTGYSTPADYPWPSLAKLEQVIDLIGGQGGN